MERVGALTQRDMLMRYKKIKIKGVDIFYREAGDPGKPVILLLHGFPASSHMYRDLMRDLADNYHLIAPDYPGFGNSDMPDANVYAYTFDNLSETVEAFIDSLGLTEFSLYIQDYGAPVGYRIAVRRPELINALLIQNGNAYVEGLGTATAEGRQFWVSRNPATENVVRKMFTLEGTQFQYLHGVQDPEKIAPDAMIYDQHFLDRPGNAAIQLDLFYDYRNNIPLYPTWQDWLRKYQPPTLITWGKNDALFIAEGATAYLRDLPSAELHLLNTGHFALEEFHAEIAALIHAFLKRKLK